MKKFKDSSSVGLGDYGRILPFNTGALQSTISQIWKLKNGVETREIGDNLFTFQFLNWKDKERVLKGEPWWFDKRVLVLCELKGREQPSDLRPCCSPFWVQIFYIPFNLRSETVAKQIGNVIGTFLEWENKGVDKWGKFLRIRVLLNLENPLKKGTILKCKNGAAFKVFFKYERLLDFCYNCGRVGHVLKDCAERESEDDMDSSNLSFGPWMRATLNRGRSNFNSGPIINKTNQRMVFKNTKT